MTSLPDWLVERAALDEVAPASRDRVDRADPRELADRIAALRTENASELASHPAGPAVAQIEARVAAATKQRAARRRRLGLLAITTAASVAVAVLVINRPAPEGSPEHPAIASANPEYIGIKGITRLLAYRQAGDHVEKLEEGAIVRAGDLIQLRYNGGGRKHGVIASIDGAGAVTLHYPVSETAAPEDTALAPDTNTLPNAYALDDAPRFERFFFITAESPIDVQQSLAALRAHAQRTDCATAALELPAGLQQLSLRLRKPSSRKAPTP
jgi:hypothetical protein